MAMSNGFNINVENENIVIEDYGPFLSNLKIIAPYYEEYLEKNVFSKFGRIYKCNKFNDNSDNLINFTGRTCEVLRGDFNSMWDTFTLNDKGAHLTRMMKMRCAATLSTGSSATLRTL